MISNFRIVTVVLLFAATFWSLQLSESVKETPIRRSLHDFPTDVGKFSRVKTTLLSNPTLNMLKTDEYIVHDYISPDGCVLNLFVGYYGSVEQTKGYHSPRNCVPASGWDIISRETLQLNNPYSENDSTKVNMLHAKKGINSKVILYWYQNRGRIISSEYWEKIYQVYDSIFRGRRDGSLVMITVNSPENRITETAVCAKEFAENVMVTLRTFLPGYRE